MQPNPNLRFGRRGAHSQRPTVGEIHVGYFRSPSATGRPQTYCLVPNSFAKAGCVSDRKLWSHGSDPGAGPQSKHNIR